MLTTLRANVQGLTRSHKVTQVMSVSRTFYVLASPGVAHIRGWYSQEFPTPHPDAADMYQWLVVGDDESEFRAAAARAVATAFSATLENKLRTTPDFRFLESLSQVLVVADLSEPEAIGRIEMARRVLGEEVSRVVAGGGQGEEIRANVEWTGVFTLRHPPGAAADAMTRLGTLMHASGFRRILLVDYKNPAGRLLSGEKDAHIVAAEALYFLTFYPARLGAAANFYDEWLKRCPAGRGFVSGAAAISLVLPVDQVLEAVALYRGSDVVERAFLSEDGQEHSGFYVTSFLKTAGLLSALAADTTFSTHDDVKLEDPLAPLDGLEPSRLEEFTSAVTELDAALPGAAESNGKKIREIAGKRLADWKLLLEDHVESILMQEAGGLRLARKFLVDLRAELLKLIPNPDGSRQPPANLAELLAALKKTIETGPRTATLLARALALALVADVGTHFLPMGLPVKVAIMVGVPLVSFGVAALMILSFKDRVSRQGEEVRRELRAKWANLMRAELDRALREFLGLLVEQTKQVEKEVFGAERRVRELVDFLRNSYSPPLPEEYAAWCYVLRTREQMLAFADLCAPDIVRVTDSYMKPPTGYPPLHPWRRLAPAKSEDGTSEPSEPNAWEWSLLEKAACLVLPSCSEIVFKGVLDYLPDSADDRKAFVHTLVAGAEPYVSLRAGRDTQGERLAVVELDDASDQPVAGELRHALEAHFQTLRQQNQLSRYRISILGFLENALITDVVIGSRKGGE